MGVFPEAFAGVRALGSIGRYGRIGTARSGVSTVDTETRNPDGQRWSLAVRIVFRFGVVYSALFCLMIGQIVFVFAGIGHEILPEAAPRWPLQQADPLVKWVGREVFGVDATLRTDSGSGDQTAIWVLVFCMLVVAAGVTVIWSVVDRRRPAYPCAATWFLLFIRWCLAGQMLFYGIAKAIPSQMPTPPLSALIQPYGQLTPMEVLWLQVGSSPGYEILLGTAELLGGLLLLLPRTATLGAMLSLVCMAQVFVLNMTFDVPVKILSFHLVVFSLVLLAPQARRLADMFLLARRADPAVQPPLFAGRRANRYAALAQAALSVWIVVGVVHIGWTSWNEFGGGAPKPALYGLWEVTEFRSDGQPVPPLLTDGTRWQRLVIEFEGALTYQRMNGALVTVPAQVDTASRTMTILDPPVSGTVGPPRTPSAVFAYSQPTVDSLRLEGQLDSRATLIELRSVDLENFPLNGPRFHWVQDYPSSRR